MSRPSDQTEYIVEFEQHGSSVKVSAIDPVTLTEVSIVGPSSAGQAELSRAAVQKLLFVLNKEKGEPKDSPQSDFPAKSGIIV